MVNGQEVPVPACRVYFEKDKVADTQGPRFLEFEKCGDGELNAVPWILLDMLAARGAFVNKEPMQGLPIGAEIEFSADALDWYLFCESIMDRNGRHAFPYEPGVPVHLRHATCHGCRRERGTSS